MSSGASGGSLHGGASLKVEKAHLPYEKRVRRTAGMKLRPPLCCPRKNSLYDNGEKSTFEPTFREERFVYQYQVDLEILMGQKHHRGTYGPRGPNNFEKCPPASTSTKIAIPRLDPNCSGCPGTLFGKVHTHVSMSSYALRFATADFSAIFLVVIAKLAAEGTTTLWTGNGLMKAGLSLRGTLPAIQNDPFFLALGTEATEKDQNHRGVLNSLPGVGGAHSSTTPPLNRNAL